MPHWTARGAGHNLAPMSVQSPVQPTEGKDAAPQGGLRLSAHAAAMDSTALEHLLALAGPDAGRLMEQLSSDLAAVERDLRLALAEADGAALRAATHVLISLAGTVGATELTAAARALNIAAHGADWPAAAKGIPPVLAGLAGLRAAIAERVTGARA